jgi:hypothetical protein
MGGAGPFPQVAPADLHIPILGQLAPAGQELRQLLYMWEWDCSPCATGDDYLTLTRALEKLRTALGSINYDRNRKGEEPL